MLDEAYSFTEEELSRIYSKPIQTADGKYENVLELIRICDCSDDFIRAIRSSNGGYLSEASDDELRKYYKVFM